MFFFFFQVLIKFLTNDEEIVIIQVRPARGNVTYNPMKHNQALMINVKAEDSGRVFCQKLIGPVQMFNVKV